MLDVLVIAPHPDDAELGMGTIALMQAQGLRVGVLDLTDGEPTPRGSLEIRARETAAATAALGLKWRENLGLPNRRLRATLAALRVAGRSDPPRASPVALARYAVDAHPDHVAATKLVEAVRFWAKLTKCDLPGDPWHPERIDPYWSVHLKLVRRPAFVVDTTTTWTNCASLNCYASQFDQTAPKPTVLDRVEAASRWWGATIGTLHGEPFSSREPVALRGFADLF